MAHESFLDLDHYANPGWIFYLYFDIETSDTNLVLQGILKVAWKISKNNFDYYANPLLIPANYTGANQAAQDFTLDLV